MKLSTIIKNKSIRCLNRIKRIKKRTLYCIVAGILLSIFSYFINKQSIYIGNNEIARSIYGTKKIPYRIKMDVENLERNLEVGISVSPKKYTKEEADKVFDKKIEELKKEILDKNNDFEHVSEKLYFKSELGDGVKALYSFDPILNEKTSKKLKSTVSNTSAFDYYVKYQNLIDGYGNVNNINFTDDEVCTGNIEIQLLTDIKDKETAYKSEKYLIPIKVVAKKLSAIESFKNAFKNEVIKKDKDTIEKPTLVMPKVINSFSIKYKEDHDLTFLLMPLVGLLIAILLEARDREHIKEIEKKRIRYLEMDFTQIISKLLLFVSSGMTIRNSFIRMADQYLCKLKTEKTDKRASYDELLLLKSKLNSGYSEIKAYEDMAKNINLRTYTRFLNIIIQSIKNGNKELKNILNMEVQDALYERKQKAKKMGEEAATKLVLPLMMMLAVIMVVIMVPAFMGM